jgi:transcriptional regulator with XRE-family HTH domain
MIKLSVKIENGHTRRPFISTLSSLADALNAAFEEKGLGLKIEIEDLMEDEPTEEIPKPAKKSKDAENKAQIALL